MSKIDDAVAWLTQSRSDARAAGALLMSNHSMTPGDVGCHVALLCAQSFEKCIKGSLLLVGQTLTLTHEVEISIDSMLREAQRRREPWRRLRACYDARDVRRFAKMLLALTPGAANADEPNYEYPWRKDEAADLEVPCGHAIFESEDDQRAWVQAARTLSDEVAKIAEAIRRYG